MYAARNVRSAFTGFHLKQVGCRRDSSKLLATFLKLVPKTVIVNLWRMGIIKKSTLDYFPVKFSWYLKPHCYVWRFKRARPGILIRNMDVSMKHWLNDTDRGKPKYWQYNLFPSHFVHYKRHMDWLLIRNQVFAVRGWRLATLTWHGPGDCTSSK
jgi:hypothetical protein